MKKLLVSLSVLAVSGVFASGSFAAQPVDPGCFGQDRAAGVHAISGKVWGDIASDRAGTNGDLEPGVQGQLWRHARQGQGRLETFRCNRGGT